MRTPVSSRGSTRGSRRAGLTLVEVILAMGLLLLGMTSVLGLLSFGAALARTGELRAQAAAASAAVVADLEETLFPLERDPVTGELLVGEPRDVVDRPVPGQPGLVYSASARVDPRAEARRGPAPTPDRYRVDVELRWSSGGRARTRQFTTLLLREVPFGERMRRLFVSGDVPDRETSDEARP